MLMDLRQQRNPVWHYDLLTFLQEFPYIRLDEETARAGFFGRVRKCIQADHGSSVLTECF